MLLLYITLISSLVWCSFALWAPCSALLYLYKHFKLNPPPDVLACWRLLKWPSLAGIIAMAICSVLAYRTLLNPNMWPLALFTVYWVLFRNIGKDDDKPKQQRRIRARVKRIGGRLVVVPEPT